MKPQIDFIGDTEYSVYGLRFLCEICGKERKDICLYCESKRKINPFYRPWEIARNPLPPRGKK
jgi:hypothetical protein